MTELDFSAVDLEGHVVIVTGAAAGIGRATAELVCKRGGAVFLTDRDGPALMAFARHLEGSGAAVHAIEADTSQERDVDRVAQACVSVFGFVSGAVNNAGVSHRPAPMSELSLDEWQAVIGINLTGTFLCLKYFLPPMVERGRGAIVNMASRSGTVAAPNLPAYVASKHGVIGLTRSAAADYGASGVRVNAVAPGVVETAMSQQSLKDPKLRASREQAHPIGRFGQPAEVAEVAAWLLSDASSFVTGSVYFVDGGAHAI